MWETLPGSIDLRFSHPNYYVQLLKDGEGRMSTSTEDIEECSLELTGVCKVPERRGDQRAEEGFAGLFIQKF